METLRERAKEEFKKKKRLVNQVVAANIGLEGPELLNWAMNQLFMAARTLDIVNTDPNNIRGCGCDATATVILKKLVKTKEGWDLIYLTNPKLLRGYKKPTQ
jgi:hypothetical protein